MNLVKNIYPIGLRQHCVPGALPNVPIWIAEIDLEDTIISCIQVDLDTVNTQPPIDSTSEVRITGYGTIVLTESNTTGYALILTWFDLY